MQIDAQAIAELADRKGWSQSTTDKYTGIVKDYEAMRGTGEVWGSEQHAGGSRFTKLEEPPTKEEVEIHRINQQENTKKLIVISGYFVVAGLLIFFFG